MNAVVHTSSSLDAGHLQVTVFDGFFEHVTGGSKSVLWFILSPVRLLQSWRYKLQLLKAVVLYWEWGTAGQVSQQSC